uniref:Uncharacterized protein n=1 Tax=Amphora coffeiformis TaxID=265554 RepID=A0A7S3L3U4_9STRA|mmetsp:Transcript_21373/g.40615  ORF Transcript_21373/g.40615 Transcript_21373/m.40615 type:complete len:143 (+) Transcript_21373:67-495(+)|eukprot:scaffold9564_cov132-Amphora_coffeaeformis.AAC.3
MTILAVFVGEWLQLVPPRQNLHPRACRQLMAVVEDFRVLAFDTEVISWGVMVLQVYHNRANNARSNPNILPLQGTGTKPLPQDLTPGMGVTVDKGPDNRTDTVIWGQAEFADNCVPKGKKSSGSVMSSSCAMISCAMPNLER